MIKRRSSKEIIQSVTGPNVEHAYVKFPGRELVDVTFGKSDNKKVKLDIDKIRGLADEYGIKKYTDLHTHATGDSIPSGNDINGFLRTPNAKTMVIASQDPNNGQIEGYYFLRKRNKLSPEYAKLKELEAKEKREYNELVANQEEDWKNYELRAQKRNSSMITKILGKVGIDISLKPIQEKYKEHIRKWNRVPYRNFPKEDTTVQMEEDVEDYERNMIARRMKHGMEALAAKYNLQYRFVPEKGYVFNSAESFRFKKKGLEKKVAVTTSIIGLFGGMVFFSSNITGNVIGSLNQSSSNGIGVVLFIIGLIGAFAYFRKR